MAFLEYLCPLGHVVKIAQTTSWAPPKSLWECKQCQARVRVHLRNNTKRPKDAN